MNMHSCCHKDILECLKASQGLAGDGAKPMGLPLKTGGRWEWGVWGLITAGTRGSRDEVGERPEGRARENSEIRK